MSSIMSITALRAAPVHSKTTTKVCTPNLGGSSAFLTGSLRVVSPTLVRAAGSNRRSSVMSTPVTHGAAAGRPVIMKASAEKSVVDEKEKSDEKSAAAGRLALLATVASHPFVFGCQEAMAKGGEFGLLEGRTSALIHPFFLGGMWFASVYAGYLGWQWRRVRTTGDEISALKATMPASAGADGAAVELSPAQKETQGKIDELTATRKELVAGGYKDKHNNVGSFLLAFGTCLAVEGGMNTYLRTGKLFPGPHLFAGMGIVCLWAAAAGLVPEMQKGNNTARNLHIALNAVNVALFTWQIPTGLEIVGKVFQFTSWP